MRKWLDKTTALVLCSALVLAACGGDDDEAAPVEPEPEPVAEITPEIIGLYGTVVSSFQTIFFAALIPGTTSVPGEGGGSVEIAGNDWTLNEYSPDGALIVNGALNVGIDQTPIPLTGEVTLVWITGSRTGAQYGAFGWGRRPFCYRDDNHRRRRI